MTSQNSLLALPALNTRINRSFRLDLAAMYLCPCPSLPYPFCLTSFESRLTAPPFYLLAFPHVRGLFEQLVARSLPIYRRISCQPFVGSLCSLTGHTTMSTVPKILRVRQICITEADMNMCLPLAVKRALVSLPDVQLY